MSVRRKRSAAAFAALACAAACIAPAPAAPGGVTTFAGTGAAGNLDGPLARATFASPAGIAVAPNGDVYVADRALDTIRLIHDGTVRTIVGAADGDPVWRPGGFRDGPGARAQLRHPEAIALAPDGSLVIADTWNAAVRRYKNGVVTTIAGAPARWGYADGPAQNARFHNPIALAIDAAGTIYVSDLNNPLRKIAPNGTVSSLAVKTTGTVFGLAAAPPDRLFIADEGGLLEIHTGNLATDMHLTNVALRERATTEAGAPLGRPYALAALDAEYVAYSDVADDSIRVAARTRIERVAGAPAADPNEAGGYRDGAPLDALFDAPAGLAAYRGGWLVADMGNHRIRYVPGADRRDAVRAGRLDRLAGYLAPRKPPLVLIGDSEVWTDTTYDDSIAGVLQGLRPSDDVVPVTLPGQDDPSVVGNFVANVLDLDRTATVVYLFDDAGVTHHDDVAYATLASGGTWTATLEKQFAALRAQCGAARLIVADVPIGLEVSPAENAVSQAMYISDSSEWENVNAVHAQIAAAAKRSGVRYADLWPAFRDIDASGHGPLYHPLDVHLTAAGRSQLAGLIAGVLRVTSSTAPPP